MIESWRARRVLGDLVEEPRLPSFYEPAAPDDVAGMEMDGSGVGEFVPSGFEACAWLPNPAWKWVRPESEGATPDFRDDRPGQWAKPVKWSEVAASTGKAMNERARWPEISGPSTEHGSLALSPDQTWTWGPTEGTLEPSIAKTLCKTLTHWTDLEDRCLCGIWEGGSSGWDTKVKLVGPHWTYFVWACRFGDLTDWLVQPNSFEREAHQPHVVWPEDRNWFWATLYSGCSNYFAGPRQLVDAILESDVEAYEVELSVAPH